MSTARQLLVLINDTTVGTLSAQDDIWRFAYTPEWIASPQAFALAPGLPLSTTEYIDGASQRPVQWHFDNLLPEEQLRSVLAKEAQIDEADAFGLLGYFGLDRLLPHAHPQDLMTPAMPRPRNLRRTAILLTLGISLHNFPEGIATYVTASNNLELGMGVALAVGDLHHAERVAAEPQAHGLGIHRDRGRAGEGALG